MADDEVDAGRDAVDAALLQLSSLVGLAEVKKDVQSVVALARIAAERASRGIPTGEVVRHVVMTGNPGTGKTTVARLLGQIYCGYGLLQSTKFKEVNGRSGLVAGTVGGTAPKTRKAFNEALGGVFFVDEAYSLTTRGHPDFALEAVTELVALMENHRDDIMVVLAGDAEQMRSFLQANPGLASRFGRTMSFPDLTEAEMMEYLRQLSARGGYVLTEGAEAKSAPILRSKLPGKDGSDNIRMVRRLYETAVSRHASRVDEVARIEGRSPTDTELTELLAVDIPPEPAG